MAELHYFGVRHHGPGCARSLARALAALRPDCVLIEGPPEADALMTLAAAPDMRPPVALLTYSVDPPLAVYHPFAEFSPEWQAMCWAAQAGVTMRFIDLPVAQSMAIDKAERDAAIAAETAAANEANETSEANDTQDMAVAASEPAAVVADPLDWLARAAGHADGETWWNHMVEERGDGEQLFDAIAEMMTAVRSELGDRNASPAALRREAVREAHMRQCIRAAQKEGFATIAIVCGAWHLPALREETRIKADQALLSGLPKLKVQTTWVPWTYRHLSLASGYGAGIAAPGWYEHLWRSQVAGAARSAAWLARIAQLLRARDLDCSSAHLIEAVRLADALAALRGRPAPGLEEFSEATRTVLTMGDDAALRFVNDELIIGDRLGEVPLEVPVVPLQRDLEQQQKRLRLKAEAVEKLLDLDLRNDNDLARSHLLHRLDLLGVTWGVMAKVGRSQRGTFHEIWTLQWDPAFALRLIESSRFGQSIAEAATARALEQCRDETQLPALSALIDKVLLADLDTAVAAVTQALQDGVARTGDAAQLLAALPPLANVYRYGNVRKTDAAQVGHVLDGLIVRAALGLPLACQALDEAAADELRSLLLAAHSAVGLRQGDEQTAAWRRALDLIAVQQGASELLQGLACRLLLDDGEWTSAQAAAALALNLSAGAEPARAAAWLDGFLNRNAAVLLHDPEVWGLVDGWLASLSDEHFVNVLPLVRRTFSLFASNERRDLGALAARGASAAPAAAVVNDWDERRALLPQPLLRRIYGMVQ